MPGQFNNALDDPLMPDATIGFVGGCVSDARRNLLGPQQYARGANTMIGEDGLLTTRRGCSQLSEEAAGANAVQGLGYFDTLAGTQQLLRARAGVIQKHDGSLPSAWATVAGFTPHATAPLEMVQGINLMYLSNGVDNMRSYDGSAFTDLGSGATDAPKAKYILWHGSRLVAAGIPGAPDTIAFANILDASTGNWPLNQRLRVGAGDGDPITGLAAWTKTLILVFKRSSVWVIGADPATTVSAMPIDRVHPTIGCVSHRSIAQVGADVWFLSDDGVRSVARTLQGADQAVSLPISAPIGDSLAQLNQAGAATACAAFFHNRYLLAFPSGEATTPNIVVSYHTKYQAWETHGWTGWPATVFARSNFSGLQRLQFARTDGRVWQWRHWPSAQAEATGDFEDAGGDIATTIETRSHAWSEPFNRKRPLALELEFNRSRAVCAVGLIVDEAETPVPLASVTSGLGQDFFPLTFPFSFESEGIKRLPLTLLHQAPLRELGIRLTSTKGKLALRAVHLSAYPHTLPTGA